MENPPGENLFSWLSRRTRVNVKTTRNIILKLSKALTYIHSLNFSEKDESFFPLAHYDLKPENILVCNDNSIRILDFGLSYIKKGNYCYPFSLKTLYYRSPETQGQVSLYGSASDIWALGCVYFELRTGSPL